VGNLTHPGRVLVLGGPAGKELGALFPHLGIREPRGAAEAQTLEQGFIGKGPLEAGAGILDEAVEKSQGTQLAVQIAVLELLPDGTGSLGGSRVLEVDDLDEVRDAAEVVDGDGLTRESLDGHRDCRVGLLLKSSLAWMLRKGRATEGT
jgi:hypothetical protein